MGLVGTAALIAGYDLNVFGLAMPQIQKELAIAEEDAGATVAIIRLGTIGALFLTMLADRVGWRTLLMFTIIGSAVSTLLTGFVETQAQFTLLQTLVRVFSYGEDMLCIVIIAEEFETEARGWAIGAIGALTALGIGLAALLFELVNVLPFGWRALYVIGAIALFLIAWFRRYLAETRCFQETAAAHRPRLTVAEWLRPAFLLVREPRSLPRRDCSPHRICPERAAGLPLQASPRSTRLRAIPSDAAFILGGLVSVLGTFIAGKASDRWGRRVVLMGAVLGCLTAFSLFNTAEPARLAIVTWIAGTFCLLAYDVLISAFGAELFPISHRATASGPRFATTLFSGTLVFGWKATFTAISAPTVRRFWS